MNTIPGELHREILTHCSAKTIINAFVSRAFFAIGYSILRGRSKRPDLYDIPAEKLMVICAGSSRLRRKLCKTDYCLMMRGKFSLCVYAACRSRDPDLFSLAVLRDPHQAHSERILAAAAAGDNELISSLAAGFHIEPDLLKRLAAFGKLHRVGVRVTNLRWIFIDACVRGNMNAVVHLLTRHPEESDKMMMRGLVAAGQHSGKLSCKRIFLYLLDNSDVSVITSAMNRLCRKGPPWIIYAMISAGATLNKRGVKGLCKGRRHDMIDLLCRYAGDLSDYLEYAGRAGDWEFIRQIRARGKCVNLAGAMYGACEMYRTALCAELVAEGVTYCPYCDSFL
jgi:hypothetical protein